MNKFLKKACSISVALLLLGSVLLIVGSWLGGKMIFSYTPGENVITNRDIDVEMVTKEVDSFKAINVENDDFDVKIINGDNYSVTYPTGENLNSSYKIDGDTLKVSVKGKNKFGINISIADFTDENPDDHSIVVTVPEKTDLDSITVITQDGDCAVDSQTADTYNLTLYCGDLSVTNSKGKTFKLKNSEGDISINDTTLKTFSGKLSDGDATISNSNLDKINIELSEGDFTLSDSVAKHINNKQLDGDFTLSYCETENLDSKLYEGDFTAKFEDGETNYSTNLSAEDGDIYFAGDDKGTKFQSKNSSKKSITASVLDGDITVEFGE